MTVLLSEPNPFIPPPHCRHAEGRVEEKYITKKDAYGRSHLPASLTTSLQNGGVCALVGKYYTPNFPCHYWYPHMLLLLPLMHA